MRPILTSEQRALLRSVALHIANTCEPEIPPAPGNAWVYGDAWLVEPSQPATAPAPAFDRLAARLPGGTCWGDPLTPELVAHLTGLSEPVAWRWWSSKWHAWEYTEDPNQVPAHTPCEALFLNR